MTGALAATQKKLEREIAEVRRRGEGKDFMAPVRSAIPVWLLLRVRPSIVWGEAFTQTGEEPKNWPLMEGVWAHAPSERIAQIELE
jgi:hypothetical protein